MAKLWKLMGMVKMVSYLLPPRRTQFRRHMKLMRIGERVCNLERAFNVREGISRKDDILPERFMKEPMPSGPAKGHRITKEDLDMMLDEYYKLRGWDSQGIPTEEKLKELGLREVAEELRKYVTK